MRRLKQIRKLVMTVLVSTFLVQGWFVYTDKMGRQNPALSQGAQHGQQIWRTQNCQTCHQLFGLGGFLGPDLTHVTERFPRDAFGSTLQNSPSPMPVYNLGEADMKDLYTFLQRINQAGNERIQAKTKNNFNFAEIPWFTTQ